MREDWDSQNGSLWWQSGLCGALLEICDAAYTNFYTSSSSWQSERRSHLQTTLPGSFTATE